MDQMKRYRAGSRGVSIGRLAASAVAVGGIAASLLSAGVAGAASTHTAKLVVSTVKSSKTGTFLSSGKTLYTLNKPSKTACTAACLKIWPALLLPKGVSKPTAGSGVNASKLGTVKRANGLQVTYGGKPLYFFSEDKKAGQVSGDVTDTWGTWGAVVTVAPKKSTGSGSTGGTGSGGTNTGTGGVAF